MKIKDLEKNKIYIIGVSGGMDSMVLLDMAYKCGLNIVVAHVNYQKRISSDRDMEIVKTYCHDHFLPFECLFAGKHEGNFQAWARKLRYDFFTELLKKYHGEGILIAHHQDDLIETYLLQKQRRQIPLYWGINEVTQISDMIIYRPMLTMTKLEVEKYCFENKILYGEDESNADNRYTRNKIRHQIVNKLDRKQREAVLNEIKSKNEVSLESKTYLTNRYEQLFDPFNQTSFRKEKLIDQVELVRLFLLRNGINSLHYSSSYLKEIVNFVLGSVNREIQLEQKNTLALSYGKLIIFDKSKLQYSYQIENVTLLKTDHFEISDKGDRINAVTVDENDFPLTIRSWQEGDVIKLRFGHKKINRWFIDRKIDIDKRYSWPIVINRNQEIILVPKIGCNVAHFSNNPNMFVLEL